STSMTMSTFKLPVDEKNKATEIRIWDFSRPHMRAFHLDWLAFFFAFFAWFAVNPLVIYIRISLNLCSNGNWDTFTKASQCKCNLACKTVLANGNILSAVGSIAMRLVMGTLVENVGPRRAMAFIVFAFAIPTAGLGLVTTPVGYEACRFFIGGIGSAFVVCQFWTSIMFSKKVVGAANAIVGGWGNMGGGFTQIIMPYIVVGLVALGSYGYGMAWRLSFLIPASCLVFIGLCLYFSDDVPEGNFKELFASGERKKQDYKKLFYAAASDPRVWALCMVYGGCFGSEVSMNQQLAPYFFDYFELNPEAAGWAAAAVGLSNIFARALGGMVSDWANARFGHRARHWVLFVLMIATSMFMIGFSRMKNDNLAGAMVLIAFFSVSVSACNGACYSVVPYIGEHLKALGPVSGIVGAGGNVGAALWNAIYKYEAGNVDPRAPFFSHGFAILGCAMLVPFVHYATLGSCFFPATIKQEEQPDVAAEKIKTKA
ncbi:major facilitator superfamily domain-containing protein, partial [Pavlovales sp. CCMP2436]